MALGMNPTLLTNISVWSKNLNPMLFTLKMSHNPAYTCQQCLVKRIIILEDESSLLDWISDTMASVIIMAT